MERESDVRAGLHVAIVYVILAAMESWSVGDVCGFLIENGFDEEVVELFRCNKIRPLFNDFLFFIRKFQI